MKFHLFSPTNVIITFLIIALVFLFQILKQKRAKSSKNKNPPQPKGAWPIIGHLRLLGGSDLPHRVLGRMAETCGPIFTIKLGVHQALVVSNGEIAKECFTINDKVFASRPLAVELMGYNYAMFGLGPYGDYWREMRKINIVELLSQRRVEMLGYIRVAEVREAMKDIFESWVRNVQESTADSNMVRVEMKQLFGNLSLNIISRTISGRRFTCNDDEAVVRVHAVVRKFFDSLGIFLVSDFVPYVKFLDLGGHERAMKIVAKEMDNILAEWLEEHKKRREHGRQSEGKLQDFMDVLIPILEGASKDEFPGFFDSDAIIKATILTILAGSVDTTTVTLTWATFAAQQPKSIKNGSR